MKARPDTVTKVGLYANVVFGRHADCVTNAMTKNEMFAKNTVASVKRTLP